LKLRSSKRNCSAMRSRMIFHNISQTGMRQQIFSYHAATNKSRRYRVSNKVGRCNKTEEVDTVQ
jgi:hypothetical protein